MEQLPRLQARIASLHELRDLIRALRALAASHVQEAQAALAGIRRYTEVVEDAIAAGASLLPDIDRHGPAARQPAADILIVVCSEHGFAGAFNERLLDRAEAERTPGQSLAIIGRRGAAIAEERGLDAAWSFPKATRIGGVMRATRQVAAHLTSVTAASIVFGSYRRGGDYEVEARRVLPLDPALLVRSSQRSPPLHHLAPEVLIERLAREYLLAEITRAVTESLASENGARLRVMEMADHNIGDKLEDLGRTEHALRQEAITSELLDVVTGSEAVLEHPD
jgi:F-type H+-transporting ATPase subunit gamma